MRSLTSEFYKPFIFLKETFLMFLYIFSDL